MLAISQPERRQQSRSICISLHEITYDTATAPRCSSYELETRLKRSMAKLLPQLGEQTWPFSSSLPQDLFRSTQGRRYQSECLNRVNVPFSVVPHDIPTFGISDQVAQASRQHQIEESEPKPYAPTNNDAPLSNSSCIGVTHDRRRTTDKPHETKSVQAKRSAQSEWERLWYSGVSVSFSKIAHHFPELQCSASVYAGLSIAEPTLAISSLAPEDRAIFEKEEKKSERSSFIPRSEEDRQHRIIRAQQASNEPQKLAFLLGLPTFDEYLERKSKLVVESQTNSSHPSKRQVKREARYLQRRETRTKAKARCKEANQVCDNTSLTSEDPFTSSLPSTRLEDTTRGVMTHERKSSKDSASLLPAQHRPLVVGLTKPQSARSSSTMASSSEAAALNKEIEKNVKSNTKEAAPSEDNPTAPSSQKPKKEKAPKQPKPQKAAAPVAPTSPALIDLRVGHILRAITHPNADSLYVSTIAMGDAEGTEHTQVDEETGKVVRTVCSGLNGLVPLEEMQNRKIVVVANLKPVNMRSIKSAAMVLAASPKQPEGADPHAADRVVELVTPPEGSEAGDKVYFEGWPYGEGKGPEKVLNPKKKQWEAIQPGFYTSDDLLVGFDASQCEEVDGAEKGNLVVEGKGPCTVKTLKGAVVR